MNFRPLTLIIIILTFSFCSNKTDSLEININNLEEKIDQAFLDSELHDNTQPLIPVLFFIDNHKVNFTDPCILSKINHLRALKKYTLSKSEDFLGNLKKGVDEAEFCNDYAVKTALNNLLGIFYHGKNKNSLSVEYYNKAVYFGELNKDKTFVVDTYFSLCRLYTEENDWKRVLINAEKGIIAIGKSKSKLPRLKYFHIFLAEANINLSKFKLAEANLLIASKLTNKLADTLTTIKEEEDFLKSSRQISLTNAKLNRKQKNFDLAYKYLKASDSLLILNNLSQNELNRAFLSTESELEDKLLKSNKAVIFNQKLILVGSILFLLICFYLIFKSNQFSNKLKFALKEKDKLNEKLHNNYDKLEEVHSGLIAKNAEINTLLKYNEQTLFTKTLKISNYKDAVNNVVKNIDKLIENKETIESVKMHSVNRSLQQVISEEEIWEDFKIEFEKNRPDFFEKLITKCESLSITEQKHCAYVAVNLKSKEVASILNLSPRSVETTRYRIKKKLELEESLQGFLNGL
ncbi:regulatory protein, luxR family [Polaribacter sp. KT25b]|uniref:helix-turn-helix transcriptional regulator n=1 Tax=Polaribacter sp. KT25b TaxID=1855336 RepID=UPI000879869C|nr:LuxR C-terminal-related transcriptional regulator [Polaribacter sp. KT25b]SDS14437.1 regulatory protein, luxR family [Polaribacter sp. KT25b]